MDPIAFQLGPIVVRWYGLLIATAFTVGLLLASREASRKGVNPDHIFNLTILAGVFGIIGARLYYVIFNWSYYRLHPGEIMAIWHGGLAIHGGILAGVLIGWVYANYQRLKFWTLADIMAPSLILGQGIGRWGNYFNQEAYGYPTDLPWAMYIAGEYRHPTFLYEFIWNVIVFVLLLMIRKRRDVKEGEIFLLYLFGYSLGRLIIEGLRTDSLMLGPIRVAQLVSLALMGVSILSLYIRRRNSHRERL